MNADKLADALRAFPEDPNPFTYRRAYAKAKAALAEHDAQPAQAAPGAGNGLVDSLTAAMREADETFQRVGGSTRHYVRDCLLPILWMHGITVTATPQPPAQPSADAEEWTDRQCIEFMSVGLRHVRYADVKGAGPTCDEIRQGVRAARAAEGYE